MSITYFVRRYSQQYWRQKKCISPRIHGNRVLTYHLLHWQRAMMDNPIIFYYTVAPSPEIHITNINIITIPNILQTSKTSEIHHKWQKQCFQHMFAGILHSFLSFLLTKNQNIYSHNTFIVEKWKTDNCSSCSIWSLQFGVRSN